LNAGSNAAQDLVVATVLRPARLPDVEGMARMINRYASKGLMLPKSPAELSRHFREYIVLTEADGGVVACGGLRVYSSELAEIVGLAVDEDWQGHGLGRRVVEQLTDEARSLGIKRVFAMAFHTEFFGPLGFRTIPREWLPEKMSADCIGCARRIGCREIALLKDLDPKAPSLAKRARAGLKLLKSMPVLAQPEAR
jgi:amino-acid N-acetyltransferase